MAAPWPEVLGLEKWTLPQTRVVVPSLETRPPARPPHPAPRPQQLAVWDTVGVLGIDGPFSWGGFLLVMGFLAMWGRSVGYILCQVDFVQN